MKVVLQRVKEAKVLVGERRTGAIEQGLLLLVGFETEDDTDDITWMANKLMNLRVFEDLEGKMNLSLRDIDGDILLVSQFTLHASTKKGNRPSFIQAARPEIAIPLYEAFKKSLEKLLGKDIQTGEFGASMQVILQNDGPVTIVIDSKVRV